MDFLRRHLAAKPADPDSDAAPADPTHAPLRVQSLGGWVAITAQALEDASGLRWAIEAAAHRAANPQLTAEEVTAGWRSFTSSDGVEGRYAVGWRLAAMEAEAEAEERAAEAACQYVPCTCGRHEDRL